MQNYYHFDDINREVVFDRYDTPSPWMNYLTNGNLFTMMSQAGGNLSWYKSPEIWRIGRYNFYNLPVDVNGLFVYIKDLQTGKVWNPTVIPCDVKPDKWQSAHGLGYTRFFATKDGVTVNVRAFIGKQDVLTYDVEITSDIPKKLKVFACYEMGLMQYLREVQWQCYCKNSNDIVYNKNLDTLVYRYFPDGQPRPDETPLVYFCSNRKSSSFSGVRKDFVGNYRSLTNPVAVERDTCGNTDLLGGEGMFSMSFDVDVTPNKTEKLDIFLGTVTPQDDLANVVATLRKPDFVSQNFAWLNNYWNERLQAFQVEVADKDAQRMINTWNALQVLVNFYVCREISFYATGTVRGVGVRDAAQDCMANCMYDLPATKAKLKLIMGQQYNCGKTNHYFYPEEKAPSLVSDRSDNHLWLIYTAWQIVKEEGKLDFLNEQVPYFDGGSGTVWEHLEKSVEYTVSHLGEDGLPLMLGSDWNDILVKVCEQGKGESVFVSQMLVLACRNMTEMCKLLHKDHAVYQQIIDEQTAILNDFCWDGKWFIRAVTDEGVKIGKQGDECAQIWVNTQSWAVLSQSACNERLQSAMQAVFENLDVDYGLLILTPYIKRNWPSAEHELTFAQPGIGENAGVFCHASTWAIIAQCMLGNHEQAYKLYGNMIPCHVADKFGVELYNAEPYIYVSNIHGPQAINAGQAGVSWLSGTSSWMMMAASEYIFGLKARFDGLEISPCLPDAFTTAKATRRFRGTVYNVTYVNPHGKGNEVTAIYVDGKKIHGNVICSDKPSVDVTVVLG